MSDIPSWRRLDVGDPEGKFAQWPAIVDKMHATTRCTPNEALAWKPVQEATVALVTTAGVHVKSQPLFDLTDEIVTGRSAKSRVMSALRTSGCRTATTTRTTRWLTRTSCSGSTGRASLRQRAWLVGLAPSTSA